MLAMRWCFARLSSTGLIRPQGLRIPGEICYPQPVGSCIIFQDGARQVRRRYLMPDKGLWISSLNPRFTRIFMVFLSESGIQSQAPEQVIPE